MTSIAESVKKILLDLGYDEENVHLKGTPQRVEEFLKEFKNHKGVEELEMKIFPAEGYNELVVVRDIPFYSLCAHHILPFFGVVSVGYLPGEYICGLSKIVRVVQFFSKRLTVQEQLVRDIADFLYENLQPQWLMVVVKARHLCMEMRGVKSNSETITSAVRGSYKLDLKEEFLKLGGCYGK
jgi:GTP cyclohydrolase I